MVYFAVVFAVAASLGLIAVPPLGLRLVPYAMAWLIYSGCFGAVLAVPFAVIGWRADRRPHRTPEAMAVAVIGPRRHRVRSIQPDRGRP